jgi:hypothetical protein
VSWQRSGVKMSYANGISCANGILSEGKLVGFEEDVVLHPFWCANDKCNFPLAHDDEACERMGFMGGVVAICVDCYLECLRVEKRFPGFEEMLRCRGPTYCEWKVRTVHFGNTCEQLITYVYTFLRR